MKGLLCVKASVGKRLVCKSSLCNHFSKDGKACKINQAGGLAAAVAVAAAAGVAVGGGGVVVVVVVVVVE